MRKSRAKKREVSPDPRFNDQLVSKFINNMMLQGKKETARKNNEANINAFKTSIDTMKEIIPGVKLTDEDEDDWYEDEYKFYLALWNITTPEELANAYINKITVTEITE